MEPPINTSSMEPPVNTRHLNLPKLFTLQTNTLPRFGARKDELWRSFETTFKIKWESLSLSRFPVHMQKRALLGCLAGSAAKAHTLLAEDTEGWKKATSLELFITQVKDLFTPPAESALARLAFEEINQKGNEPITRYYSRKLEAFHQAVKNHVLNHSCTSRIKPLEAYMPPISDRR